METCSQTEVHPQIMYKCNYSLFILGQFLSSEEEQSCVKGHLGEKINDVSEVRRWAVTERGRVAVTQNLLELLMHFVLHLRVGAQQVKGPVHGGCCGVVTLWIKFRRTQS